MAVRIVGIDIGHDRVRAAEVENPSTDPRVLRYAEAALPEGAARSGEVRDGKAVADVLKELWTSAGFSSKKVVLGMGNQRELVRNLTVPRTPLQTIRESLPFQVQDLLPVSVSDALLDFYPIAESEGEHGPTVDGLLVAAIRDAVLGNIGAVRDAGLVPVNVDLIPFALSRLLAPVTLTGTTAVIDVGATTTNVVVVKDGVPAFVRIIPMGGNDVTAALTTKLSITEDEAEDLKRTIGLKGTSKQQPEAATIIRASVQELIASLRNTLNSYTNSDSNLSGGSYDRIVLTGGGAQLAGFGDLVETVGGAEVIAGDPFAKVTFAEDLGENGGVDGRQMVVAVGLAIGENS